MGASSGFRLFIKAIYAIEGIANTGRIASPFLGSTTRMENTSFVWYEEDDDDHPDGILAAYRFFGGFETWGRIESHFSAPRRKSISRLHDEDDNIEFGDFFLWSHSLRLREQREVTPSPHNNKTWLSNAKIVV